MTRLSCSAQINPQVLRHTLDVRMHRTVGIAKLLEILHTRVVPGLKAQDAPLLELLSSLRCTIERKPDAIALKFTVGDLLNGLWKLAMEDGVEVHDGNDWEADVKQMSVQLMNPWPDARLQKQGAKINRSRVQVHGPLHANEYILSVALCAH